MDFSEFISSLPPSAFVVWFFVIGSIFGSFANVLIHRTILMIQKEEESEGFSENPEGGDFSQPIPEGGGLSKKASTGDFPPSPAQGESLPSTSSPPFSRSLEEDPAQDSSDSDEFSHLTFKGMVADRMAQHFQMTAFLLSLFVKKPLRALYRTARSLSAVFFRLFGAFRGRGVSEKDNTSRNAGRSSEAKSAVREKSLKKTEREEEGFSLDITGRSRCPHCNYEIPFYLNVPVLSWFFLRGLCRNCRGKISFRYPLVELLTAGLFAGLFVLIGWKWFLLEALIFVFGLIVVSFIDLKKMILPSFFTLPGVYIGLAGGFFNPERAFSSAVLGWFFGGFILWLSGYLYFQIRKQEGMGDGDVSLMGWIGAVLGWRSIAFILIFSCFLGVLAGMWVIFRKNQSAKTPFPFGPCLAAGAVSYIILSFSFPKILQVFFPVGFF